MRTVRRQGLTFRITQPHGLRILYLFMQLGLHKGRNRLFSDQPAEDMLANAKWQTVSWRTWG
jgi:hypothetical protein